MNATRRSPLSFFPVPQADELLDSIVYRFHRLSGRRKVAETLSALFGVNQRTPPRLMCTRLSHMAALLPMSVCPDAEELVRRHTLLPALGRHFNGEQFRSAITGCLSSVSVGTPKICAGHQTVFHSNFACCPMCVAEEQEQLGFAYWHRSHQLDGVATCHRHGCDLISRCQYCRRAIHAAGSDELPQRQCRACGRNTLPVHGHDTSVGRLARLAHEALHGPLRGTDQVGLLQAVLEVTGDNTEEVCREMADIYGAGFLPNVVRAGSEDWLRSGIRSVRKNRRYGPRQLRFWRYAHTLAIADFIFGSWEYLDREIQRVADVSAMR